VKNNGIDWLGPRKAGLYLPNERRFWKGNFGKFLMFDRKCCVLVHFYAVFLMIGQSVPNKERNNQYFCSSVTGSARK